MNLLASPFVRSLAAFALAGLLALRALSAAEPPADDNRLTITQGAIAGITVSGKPMPATLRNLADQLMRRYPDVTVNIIGVDDVVVGDLSLRWPRRRVDQGSEDIVAALLQALVESMETPTFSVARPSKDQFILSRLRHGEKGGAPRRIDVFNLKQYLEGSVDKPALEMEVRQLELRLQTMTAHYERISADVARGARTSDEQNAAKNEIGMLKEQLQFAAQRWKRASPSKDEIAKRLDQLYGVVESTLKHLPNEKTPEFEYHAGTQLLVVIGSEAAIDATRKVVTALEKSSN